MSANTHVTGSPQVKVELSPFRSRAWFWAEPGLVGFDVPNALLRPWRIHVEDIAVVEWFVPGDLSVHIDLAEPDRREAAYMVRHDVLEPWARLRFRQPLRVPVRLRRKHGLGAPVLGPEVTQESTARSRPTTERRRSPMLAGSATSVSMAARDHLALIAAFEHAGIRFPELEGAS